MRQPGELDRRLALQAPVESDDGAGGVVRSYRTVAFAWSEVTPLSMRADVAADSLGAVSRYRIRLRRREDVTMRHRFCDGATVYRIVAIGFSDDLSYLVIDAEVRGD